MSSNIDQDFVEYIVKSLVGNPDKVVIERRIDEKGVLLELTVDPEDLGRIIGKRGATAQSLRTLLRALGTKNDARYNLKIVDNGPEDYERPARKAEPAKNDDNAVAKNDDTSDDSTADGSSTDDTSVDDTSNDVVESGEPELDEPDDEPSDIAKKTRRELEDLDDLDI
jgi:predicted RNA-binding protein YlqC (UPF0109 family)